MKELCIDARMLHSSGIGIYLQNILPFLDPQFKLLLIGSEEEISALGLKNASVIPSHAPIYSLIEQLEIPFKIPKTDLFWTPHYNVPLLPVKARKRIVTIHDVFHLRFAHTLSRVQKIYATLVLNAAAKRSDHIFTVSHFSKNELRSFISIPESKVSVIYNGVHPVFNQPVDEKNKKSIRRKYSLPDNYILFVGNLKPHKNIEKLLEALRKLKQDPSHASLKLVIVGKRKGFITGLTGLDSLIERLSLTSDVLFLEEVFTEELPAIYAQSSVLVFPSLYEGFGLPPLEAMACGCATVVSRIRCLEEIYGNHTVFVAPDDPSDIAHGISKILSDTALKARLREEGKVFAKKFTWETSANQHLHIFDKILNYSGKTEL